jgi:hypothetical protein
MPIYAIISNNIVENKVVANNAEELFLFSNVQQISDDELIDIGWIFSDGIFTAPPPPPVDPINAALNIRIERNRLLVELVDPIVMNSLRWGDLSTEEQNQVSTYRRKLLDITDQENFPLNVIWPAKPSFM